MTDNQNNEQDFDRTDEEDVSGHSKLKSQERGSFPRGSQERGFNVKSIDDSDDVSGHSKVKSQERGMDDEEDVSGHSKLKSQERGSFPRGSQERGFNVKSVDGSDDDVSGHSQLRRQER